VTGEVLSAYAKSWEKASNINASQELIKGKIDDIQQTRNVFAATLQPFPTFLTAAPVSVHPCQGVVDVMEVPSANIPASISTELAISHPAPRIPPAMCVPIPTQGLPPITNSRIRPSHAQPEIYDHIVDFNQPNDSEVSLQVAWPRSTTELAETHNNDNETINNSSVIPEDHPSNRLVNR
jgi:hypothetical protein